MITPDSSTAITALDPAAALACMQAESALLVDVRESAEFDAGHARTACHLPLSVLERDTTAAADLSQTPILVICQKGPRSQRAAELLHHAGFNVRAIVEGGSDAWLAAGLPWEAGDEGAQRYSRHLLLPEVGPAGQARLNAAHVALVGAGGLGSPVALYLAAAGVGTLTLIDDDRVELSNLQRQVLHGQADIGRLKVESARDRLLALNPRITVHAVAQRLTSDNAAELLKNADVVVDGADNFATRHLVNAICQDQRKPWVYAAIQRFDGHAAVFDLRRPGAMPCYRCLFPEAPDAQFAPNCAEAGVLGVLPGLLGTIQATETLKLLLDIGETLSGRVLHVDALTMRMRESRLQRDPECPQCGHPTMR